MINIKESSKLLWKKIKEFLKLGSNPDFFILGAQKAGTTSLFHYIEDNSKNFKSPYKKELYFFTERFYKGLNYYKSYFPIFKRNKDITGEATPDYFFNHSAPKRIHQLFPNSKLIIILRDPIERAYSQYNHQNFTDKTRANDPLLFSKAIRIEEDRFTVQKESNFFYEYKYFSYLQRGLYEEQIERWLKYFDKKQIMFLDISDLKSIDKMKAIFDFLGASYDESLSINVSKKHNSNNYSKILASDKNYLTEYYKDKFNRLESMTGRTFPWLSAYKSKSK
jgi:hypothetical protein